MDRKTYEEAKKSSEEIAKLLREGNLTAEEKQKFETLQAGLAGALLSSWLPLGWGRRAIMIALLLVGSYGIVESNNYQSLAWLLLPFFSPRLMGGSSMPLARPLELYTSVRHNPAVNTGAAR